jgi:hypothetical protein
VAILRAAIIACLLAARLLPGAEPAQGTSEYEVKAAFVYNFAKFVEWPQTPLGATSFCVVGQEQAYSALEVVVRGRTIGGRPPEVKRVNSGPEARGQCQILFIASKEAGRTAAILSALKDDSILTIGESEKFLEQGGTINFLLEDSRVRFEISLPPAHRAHLAISSKLLQLATRVVGESGGGK